MRIYFERQLFAFNSSLIPPENQCWHHIVEGKWRKLMPVSTLFQSNKHWQSISELGAQQTIWGHHSYGVQISDVSFAAGEHAEYWVSFVGKPCIGCHLLRQEHPAFLASKVKHQNHKLTHPQRQVGCRSLEWWTFSKSGSFSRGFLSWSLPKPTRELWNAFLESIKLTEAAFSLSLALPSMAMAPNIFLSGPLWGYRDTKNSGGHPGFIEP